MTGGITMYYHQGAWYYRGRRFATLRAALLTAWRR